MSLWDLFLSPTFAVLLLVAWGVYRINKIGRREPLLPPGPATVPLLGNAGIFPKKDAYLKLNEWAKQYGDVYSLKLASKTIIVLSSPEAVAQVMDKNGLITASKPVQAHTRKVFGDGGIISTLPYGPKYRTWRKAANEMMNPAACDRHGPIQLGELSQLMASLLDRPEDLREEIKRSVLSTVFSIFFGVRSPSMSSPEPQTLFRLTEHMFQLAAPGEYPPVDQFPLLHYLPDRFANNWKKRSDDFKLAYNSFWNSLSVRAEKKMEAGISTGCFIETLTNRASEWNLDRTIIRNMAATYIMAAAHTTIATITWAIMLAIIYPKEQEKLREELDLVVGPTRSPTLDDMPHLPYLHAFIRELFRFRTIVPLGAPHLATEDQLYNGFLIPKGSTIFVNIWGILHDPKIFDRPNEFDPSRFMNPTSEQEQIWKKLETLPFGVGRRICPGMHFANNTIELTVASLIWGFKFNMPEAGGPHVDGFTASSTCDPLPFKCDIQPRSPTNADLTRQNFASYLPFFDKFEKDA